MPIIHVIANNRGYMAPALRDALASGKPSLLDIRVADGFGG